jgi:sigma-B regulation protein RsbU (phosphoserine phosphatase)
MNVESNQPSRGELPRASAPEGNAPARVLLIEDNPGDARLIREFIAESGGRGFEVEWTSRLEAGLNRLNSGGIAVVLLDLSLPDSHGIETFLALHARVPTVPVVVLSGLADETVAVQAVHEGAQDYLVKGEGDGRLLVRALRYAVERSRIAGQLARYAEELRRKNAQMEADLHMAREIQQVFLPQQYPVFPPSAPPDRSALRFHHLYQPAAAIGGDFFTVFPLSDTAAGVFICDVMGHGLRAALITAVLRGLVEELKPGASDAGRFLTEMNRALHAILRRTDQVMMATATYLTVDAADGEVRFSRAGHPGPLLVRRKAGQVQALEELDPRHGPALGLFEKFEYPGCRCRAEENDLLMLFTDGLYEVAGAGRPEFGRDRLAAEIGQRLALPAPQLFAELLAVIRQFAGSDLFEDDVCLVGVEFSAGPAGFRKD